MKSIGANIQYTPTDSRKFSSTNNIGNKYVIYDINIPTRQVKSVIPIDFKIFSFIFIYLLSTNIRYF